MFEVSFKQIRYIRYGVAFFLLIYFYSFFPHRMELFSSQMLGSRESLLVRFSPWGIETTLSLMFAAFSVHIALFALGLWLRVSAFGILVVFACIRSANPVLFNSPEFGFVACLVLVIGCIGQKTQAEFDRERKLISALFLVIWIYSAFCYFTFGWQKIEMRNSAWVSGDAIFDIFDKGYFRREWFGDAMRQLPVMFLRWATWFAIFVELSAPAWLFDRKTRWCWSSCVLAMHAGCLAFLSIAPVSLGLLLFHASIHEWSVQREFNGKAVRFFGRLRLARKTSQKNTLKDT